MNEIWVGMGLILTHPVALNYAKKEEDRGS